MPVICLNLAEGVPDGSYAGVGNWWDDQSHSGSYQTHLNFHHNEMLVDYFWQEGETSISLSFWFDGEGFFDGI